MKNRRGTYTRLPHAVVDLEAYRLATKVFWLSVFYDRNIPFEDVYEGVLVLMDRYRGDEDPDAAPPDSPEMPD